MIGLSDIYRKVSHLVEDPVLRRWLLLRLLGKIDGNGGPHRHTPPYLSATVVPADFSFSNQIPIAHVRSPIDEIRLDLAGLDHTLSPGEEDAFVSQTFADTETLLAMHRFSWLPLSDSSEKFEWANAIWRSWVTRHGDNAGWCWHPYTAAERLINLFLAAHEAGRAGPELADADWISKHGTEILSGLEYYGEGHTGNHLSNNGRGLYLAGLTFGIQNWVDAGEMILLENARSVFLPTGALREGSTHYHLLICRWYLECWLVAERYNRPAADQFLAICSKSLEALSSFTMPAGLPLIGDVSPDSPPSHIESLITDSPDGWFSGLGLVDQDRIRTLRNKVRMLCKERDKLDVWHRRNFQEWAIFWYLPPDGWSPQPGHGHSDFGGFELHRGKDRIFIDPGRRSYGPSGDDDKLANRHNSLLIDSCDPYPINRAHYTDEFRRLITGAPPRYEDNAMSFELETGSFRRLRGIGNWRRRWCLDNNDLCIYDEIHGHGKHDVCRYFHTILPVKLERDHLRIGSYRLLVDGNITISRSTYWTAYNRATGATTIKIENCVLLPWAGTARLSAV